ncbi:MAG: M3 family oligoendopeptidase, partial [bacterium]|nr:M3 family oligoendopeptidase [bacterium]
MTTSTKIPPAPTWDLESLFPGGSASPQFADFMKKTKAALDKARQDADQLPKKLDDSAIAAWTDHILNLQNVIEDIELGLSFAHMLTSQKVDDAGAHTYEAQAYEFLSLWEKLKAEVDALSLEQTDDAWNKLVTSDKISEISFYLNHERDLTKKKMAVEQESLALDLAVNGYHAWNRLYDKMAGDLRVEFEEDGTSNTLSLGQLATKMGDANRDVRAQAFKKMSEAWESRAELAAMTLNAQAGFRLSLYGRRGWDSPLFEPLHQAKLSQASLDAMWSVIARETSKLEPYVEAKKKLLGIDKYRWYDEFAPCGQADRLYPYDEAADFVVRNLKDFSPEMADFSRMAVDKKWIEAEDRSGKAGGGYCTGTGKYRQSRIFMTYAGSYENLLTLAHELGHAYHHHVLKDTPFLATQYPMTLAETASIFNETLVNDAAMEACDDPNEKLMLVDQKLQQAYVMFCDIHCRYLFDRSFYAERKNGTVPRARLDELMIEAQKKAYGNLLDGSGHHPLFWASKLHFFITDSPFYNYPYTFGFLFAGGVYDRAKREGSAFA